MVFCHKKNITVYPVSTGKPGIFQIEATLPKGKIKRWKKEIVAKDINESMKKTYLYYYEEYKR